MAASISNGQRRSARDALEVVVKDARELEQLSTDPPTSCSFCLALLRLIRTPRSRRLQVLHAVTADDHTCQNHGSILPSHVTDHRIRLTKPAGQRLLYIHPDFTRAAQSLLLLGAPWEPFVPEDHRSLQSDERIASRNQPRLIDREWIDINLLKKWHSTCVSSHDSICGDEERDIDQSLPKLLLIDTARQCLVQMEQSCRYVALSYVWGHANAFLTTTDNIEQLYQPGALEQQLVRLPKTIKQAIALTSALDEQYLWVDALCIVQDGQDKADQLNAMASLFSNATLTIVAAEGEHADAGFRGLRGISEPRCANQEVAPILLDQHLVRPSSKHVWDDSLLRPWSTRSWVFQESMFSRRLLYFAHDSVRWCCRKTRWSEESEAGDCAKTYAGAEQQQLRLFSPQLSEHKLPVLGEYEALVNSYNVRKLTYTDDALTAFAGIATKLGEKFRGGLISGLPEMFFDICLLWRPLRMDGHAPRRESIVSTGRACLPSWSWAGWETEVTWPYTWNYSSNPADPTPIVLGQIRPFYRIDPFYTAEDGTPIAIQASWFDDAIKAKEEESLPEWTSEAADDVVAQEWGTTSNKAVFRHNSERTIHFCIPVALSTSITPARLINLLSFRTKAGKFKLGATRKSVTRIHTMDGRPAGTLWQHNENDSAYIGATTGVIENRTSIELIAILGCTTPRQLDLIWDMPDISALTNFDELNVMPRTEDIYNVMWIARDENKVAYRKGTGVILREVWEVEAPDSIHVTLG